MIKTYLGSMILALMLSGCTPTQNEAETPLAESAGDEITITADMQENTAAAAEYGLIAAQATQPPMIKPEGQTVAERFPVPGGYQRIPTGENSFERFLQTLPLKEDGSKVLYFDGREKTNPVYLAVVDYHLGKRDLQQCADSIMRLRAEYLYGLGLYDEIHFNFVSGFRADFSKWRSGYGISVDGNTVSWVQNSKNNSSYESFSSYLDMVYAYASTLSLELEMVPKNVADLSIGDVFIKGGSPGHCVIVVDMAVHEDTGENIFMLAQGYMPAQDIQILKGDQNDSPWYSLAGKDRLYTPEWNFALDTLKTWQ